MPKSEFFDDITVTVLPIGEYCHDDGCLYPIIDSKDEALDRVEQLLNTNNVAIIAAIMVIRSRLNLNKLFSHYKEN